MASLSGSFSVSRTPAATKHALRGVFPMKSTQGAKCCGPPGTNNEADLWEQSPTCLLECQRRCDESLSLVWRAALATHHRRTGRSYRKAWRTHPCSAKVEQLGGKRQRELQVWMDEIGHFLFWVNNVLATQLTFFCNLKVALEKSNQTEKIHPSPAVTQSGVVHTGFRLERNSWPGKSLNYLSTGKMKQWKTHFEEVRLRGIVSMCVFVCVSLCLSVWWVMSMSAVTLFLSCLALLMWHYTALQHYSDYRWWRLQCCTGSLIPQWLVWQLEMIRAHLLNSWTHLACWIDLKQPKERDFRQGLGRLMVACMQRDKIRWNLMVNGKSSV